MGIKECKHQPRISLSTNSLFNFCLFFSCVHSFICFVCVRVCVFIYRNELKITLVPHLKYASDEDLKQVGLSKPEIRRLRKFYEKYYPHGYLSKIKRLLQNPAGKREEVGVSYSFHSKISMFFTSFVCLALYGDT